MNIPHSAGSRNCNAILWIDSPLGCRRKKELTSLFHGTYHRSRRTGFSNDKTSNDYINPLKLTKKGLKPLYKCSWCKEQDRNKLEVSLAVLLVVYTYNQREQPDGNSDDGSWITHELRQESSADNSDKLASFSTHHSCGFKTAWRPNIPAKSNTITIFILSYKVLISRHFHKKSGSRWQIINSENCQQLLCHVAFIQRRLETSTLASEPAVNLRPRTRTVQ